MTFENLLNLAQAGDSRAEEELLQLYRPLLMKQAVTHGTFDEDLFQELCLTAVKCIRSFRF